MNQEKVRAANYEARLGALGFTLPPPPAPVATYVAAVRCGDLLFLSGMLPWAAGKLAFSGKIPSTLTVAQGQEAARIALLNALAVVKAECGALDAVAQMVRMSVHVACDAAFVQHPQVANGASDLLVEIFGPAGRHARLALGAPSLPLDSPVELELIVRVSA